MGREFKELELIIQSSKGLNEDGLYGKIKVYLNRLLFEDTNSLITWLDTLSASGFSYNIKDAKQDKEEQMVLIYKHESRIPIKVAVNVFQDNELKSERTRTEDNVLQEDKSKSWLTRLKVSYNIPLKDLVCLAPNPPSEYHINEMVKWYEDKLNLVDIKSKIINPLINQFLASYKY